MIYVPPPVLAGWSPGDEELELPTDAFKPVTPEQQALCDNFQPWKIQKPPVEQELSEFPLYYGPTRDRTLERNRERLRSYLQEKETCRSLQYGTRFVLATSDYTVYRAESIWRLLWVYFKYQLNTSWTKLKRRRSKGLKMPSYTRVKCQPRNLKSGRTSSSQKTSSNGQNATPKKTTPL